MKLKIFLFFNFFFFYSLNLYSEIYFINLDVVLNKSAVGIEVNKQIKTIENKNLNFLNNLKEKIQIDQQNLNNQKILLSDKDYQESLNKLKIDIDQYNLKLKNLNDEIDNIKKKYKNKFLNLLEPLLVNYLKDNKISYLLQKNLAIYVDKKYDITDEIINLVDNNININKLND